MPRWQLHICGSEQLPGGCPGTGGYGQPYRSAGNAICLVPDSSMTGSVSTTYLTCRDQTLSFICIFSRADG